MYCEKCRQIVQGDRCPICKNRNLRMPEASDICFLTEQDYISSTILKDVLDQNGIPSLQEGILGPALAAMVGPVLEKSEFYVSYDQLEDARAIVEELFSGSESLESSDSSEEPLNQ